MDIINAALSPLGLGVPLALLLWWGRARLPRGLWRAGLALEIVCIALTTPLLANALVGLQERRASSFGECAMPLPSTVVVLSAGARRVPRTADDVEVLNLASLRRTLGAAQLMRRLRDAQLVITGTSDAEDAPVSRVMAALAERLGVPAPSIRIEVAARTTWENATHLRALEPALPRRVWLVTSALHLPRAMIALRAAGFDPCTYPSDVLAVPFDGPHDLWPSSGAAANSEAVIHEWIGELVYRVRTWID